MKFATTAATIATTLAAIVLPANEIAHAQDNENVQIVIDPQGFSGMVLGVDFSPDGRLVAAAGGKEVRIWDVRTGDLLHTLRGQRERGLYGNCYSVAFSPTSRELVVGVDEFGEDGSMRVYSVDDFNEIKELVGGHTAPVARLAFSRDGRHLASAAENGQFFLWDWTNRRRMGVIEAPSKKQQIPSFVSFPSNDPFLLVGWPTGIEMYAVPSGRRLQGAAELPVQLRGTIGQMFGLLNGNAFPFGGTPQLLNFRAEKGTWIAAGTAGKGRPPEYWVGCWKNGRQEPAALYNEHRWNVTSAALSADAALVAGGDKLGHVHVWDAQTGKARFTFQSVGRPVYSVGFADGAPAASTPAPDGGTKPRLYFATKPHSGAAWKRNDYGTFNHVFDLTKRSVLPIKPGAPVAGVQDETVNYDGRSLTAEVDADRVMHIVCTEANSQISKRRIQAGANPSVFTFLRGPRLGRQHPAVYGDDVGALTLYDTTTTRPRREFFGHTNMITGLSESADGRLLATSSTDQTIRLWSLKNFTPIGDADLEYLSNVVAEVFPGGEAEKAGIRKGDRFISMDGHDNSELQTMVLNDRYPYKPGDRVKAVYERDGRRLTFDVKLVEKADWVKPILSVFIANDGEWVVWTPQGYFDASPNGARLIGFHVNRGKDKSARFYEAGQFRKQLYRPDVIDKVIETGNLQEGLKLANARYTGPVEEFDLRNRNEIERIAPPVVQVLEPPDGAKAQGGSIRVRAEIRSQNDLPVRQVTLLVDGVPVRRLAPRVNANGVATVDEQIDVQPGSNTIGVVASNAAAPSLPILRTVTSTVDRPRDRPDLYVLAIGVSEYMHDKDGDLNLSFPAKDAEAVVDTIQKQKDGRLYNHVHTRLITNEDATQSNILTGVEWLRTSVGPKDVAALFISAHGFREKELAAVDDAFYLGVHETDPKNLVATSMPFSRIGDRLERFRCRVLLFVDTCHAGGIGAPFIRDPYRGLSDPEVGVVVYASSTTREASREQNNWGHSAFTKALVDTVTDLQSDQAPKDEMLALTELYTNLLHRVRTLTDNRQNPVMGRPTTIREFSALEITP